MTRQQLYTLFMILSAALLFGRITAVNRTDTILMEQYKQRQQLEKGRTPTEVLQTPVLSANDRSRWDMIRVLVEPEMRIEGVPYSIDKVQNEKNWDTIDMVKHDGHLYSSKPPLLPTVQSIPYWLIYHGSGQRLTLKKTPFTVVRIMLVVCNLLPIVLTWIMMCQLIEQFGKTDWGRIFTAAFMCFSTFVSTFAVTLNNHIPAVFCIAVALYCIMKDEGRKMRKFLAGFCTAFAAACELPALLFCVLLGLYCVYFAKPLAAQRQTGILIILGWLCAAVPFFAVNYIAHKTVLPAYSQRSWYIYEYERGGQVRQSYWLTPSDTDKGEPSRLKYIFHCTFGHHGLFSLTPVWILAFIGLPMMYQRRTADGGRQTALAAMILLTSFIVFAFYMMQAQPNRNYGGNTSCLRWMLWFVPLWILPLTNAADWLGQTRFRRSVAYLCLSISVMSVSYPVWNPWTQPWLFNLL